MKRKTKAQREQAAKKKLYRRVCDIMAGACHGDDPASGDYFVSAAALPAIVRGIEVRLLPGNYKEDRAYLTFAHNADRYDTARTLTDFLFENGIRA